tara:strand:+ start:533 stop:835 length:303 start_codon:yes stop_codon:yes gene_type:complete
MARVIRPDGHQYVLGMSESLPVNISTLTKIIEGPMEVVELSNNFAMVCNKDLLDRASPDAPELNVSAAALLNKMFNLIQPVMGTIVLLDMDDALFMSKGL